MSSKQPVSDSALKKFRRKKIMTLAALITLLQQSRRTAQRRLKQWRAINSYNKNGAYYTLPEIPRFDANGLWHYKGVSFSTYGNLTKTIIGLVRNSEAGLNASELEALIGLQSRSLLSLFRHHSELKRDKHQGRYVYFSSDAKLYDKQRSNRLKMIAQAQLPTDLEAIAILVTTIKHPEFSIEKLCGVLKKQNVNVSPTLVRNLFVYHGLTVKKTPHSLF